MNTSGWSKAYFDYWQRLMPGNMSLDSWNVLQPNTLMRWQQEMATAYSASAQDMFSTLARSVDLRGEQLSDPTLWLNEWVRLAKNVSATAATVPTSTYMHGAGALMRASTVKAKTPAQVAGRPVSFPVGVQSASEGAAFFSVDANQVNEELKRVTQASPGRYELRAQEFMPGRSLFVVQIRDYRKSDLDSYAEISAGFCVYSPQTAFRWPALFFPATSVNGQMGLQFGMEVWGYQKYFDEKMVFLSTGTRRAQCEIYESGETSHKPLVSVSIPRNGDLTIPGLVTQTYTMRDDELLFTQLQRNSSGTGLSVRNAGVEIAANPATGHEVARLISDFDIPSRPNLFSFWTQEFSERIGPPYLIPPSA